MATALNLEGRRESFTPYINGLKINAAEFEKIGSKMEKDTIPPHAKNFDDSMYILIL